MAEYHPAIESHHLKAEVRSQSAEVWPFSLEECLIAVVHPPRHAGGMEAMAQGGQFDAETGMNTDDGIIDSLVEHLHVLPAETDGKGTAGIEA